ncbi:MAG: hypothetical protein JWO08_1153 [Verrucomicrobiaceae bacterium]|nr:hypothetical protein [Verrucomicrobiaceae bacterium]
MNDSFYSVKKKIFLIYMRDATGSAMDNDFSCALRALSAYPLVAPS